MIERLRALGRPIIYSNRLLLKRPSARFYTQTLDNLFGLQFGRVKNKGHGAKGHLCVVTQGEDPQNGASMVVSHSNSVVEPDGSILKGSLLSVADFQNFDQFEKNNNLVLPPQFGFFRVFFPFQLKPLSSAYIQKMQDLPVCFAFGTFLMKRDHPEFDRYISRELMKIEKNPNLSLAQKNVQINETLVRCFKIKLGFWTFEVKSALPILL